MENSQQNDNTPQSAADDQQGQQGGQVMIQNIYIKDVSLETPNSPQIFIEMGQSTPHIDQHYSNSSKKLGDDIYEAVLTVTITVKIKEKIAFLVEVQQAGIFAVMGFSAEQVKYLLNSFCLNTLFPYLREVVSNLVIRSGFPPLLLPPVNFELHYMQQQQQQQQ